ncbi:dTDP-4-dehydrorhamnose 3,5-epimerase family protein [Prauserella cavernicola]|uniref:dTDP-4-dehydrorhamnose 3,5-epimerase family protein n=1 Tax=Prauserella cavernicola TaxID=2800127 RepID=A0A934QYY9_9PSEU|nr:dTDP-4-dehydrorhamnose 3,5-epimerase family protein [Prauserella cavernicola]MBK1787874.1 dTDP-4-dehydrorhamnose 3,5-epimerase family protein [Prauserella cavernicola]
MQARELAVEGAVEFTPEVFPDDRGLFVSPHQQAAFVDAVGAPLFPVAQTNFSESRRGVVRGIHFTATPPGSAKYTCCVRGRALDVVVDIRVGSPTFGQWDAASLDGESFRSVYIPFGVGHAFIALEDHTVISYLLSESYVAVNELAIAPGDPELGLPIPADIEPIMSARDLAAPTLAQALEAGILPDYATCKRRELATVVPTN